MSFLNPVNKTVTQYSSKDAGAPQINYASRVAGDIKAILKSCLVTGYGAKAGAGWLISAEVGAVCTFASPSALIANHKLKIDDASAANTKWSEVFKTTAAKLMGSAVSKDNTAIDTENAGNGWDLLVTECGFMFVENMFNTGVNTVGSRITYFGMLKSGVTVDGGKNIAWWCVGHNAPAQNQGMPVFFFNAADKTDKYYRLGTAVIDTYAHPCISALTNIGSQNSLSNIDLVANWWLMVGLIPVALQPAILLQLKTAGGGAFVFKTDVLNGRPVMFRWPIRGASDSESILITSHAVAIIYLDYWEY